MPRWGRSTQQLLVLKSASSTSTKVHTFFKPGNLSIDCHNKKLSEPLPHSLMVNGSKQITVYEGVAVHTTEHSIITGGHSYGFEEEQCSANSEFSNERPITDEISPAPSLHTNSEQVIRQEVTNARCSKLCTGLEPLPHPPTYLSIMSSQSHSVNHDLTQPPMVKSLPDSKCSDHGGTQLELSLASKSEGKRTKESLYYTDMERGPFYYTIHYVSMVFSGTQETFHRPGNQELVQSCPYKCSHKYNNSTQYTHTELSALERPELYIKPFTVLVPD